MMFLIQVEKFANEVANPDPTTQLIIIERTTPVALIAID